MITENEFVIPVWPEGLQHVDVVKARFVLDFLSPCQLLPADLLAVGRVQRLAGKEMLDARDDVAAQQWRSLFQPALSDDPVARRKFQKPAPAYVVTMPIMQKKLFDAGETLELEVLFLGIGITQIHAFLRNLIQLGRLGLAAGEGRFAVTKVFSREPGQSEGLAWQGNEPPEALACSVMPLTWLLQTERIERRLVIRFITPTRLMVDGKPLRKPRFKQVFPFMLRRTTSMLYAHGGIELLEDPAYLLEQVNELNVVETRLHWQDWRPLGGRQGMTVGGFLGEMTLHGQTLEESYWVFAVASLLGIGKGATYGAGRFLLSS
ncbi:MAG: CRISPR system precrRNA processing endoribonuclease RAMP protein Cas6 [Desulfuromonadales bacterium]